MTLFLKLLVAPEFFNTNKSALAFFVYISNADLLFLLLRQCQYCCINVSIVGDLVSMHGRLLLLFTKCGYLCAESLISDQPRQTINIK